MHKTEYSRQLFTNFIQLKKNMIGIVEHMEILKMQVSCVRKFKEEFQHHDGHEWLHEEFEKIFDEKKGIETLLNMEKKWNRLKESLLLMERQFQSILEYNKLLEDSVSSFNKFFSQFLEPFNQVITIKCEKEEIDSLTSILVRKLRRAEDCLSKIPTPTGGKKNSNLVLVDREFVSEVHGIISKQISNIDLFYMAYKRFDTFN